MDFTLAADLAFDTDHQGFDQAVIRASHKCPVVVDFWAEWCAPCHAIAPHLQRVIAEFDSAVLLAKVEVDAGDNMKLAGHYKLRGFPTIILFHQGRELGRFSGSRSSHWIRDWVKERLGDGSQSQGRD